MHVSGLRRKIPLAEAIKILRGYRIVERLTQKPTPRTPAIRAQKVNKCIARRLDIWAIALRTVGKQILCHPIGEHRRRPESQAMVLLVRRHVVEQVSACLMATSPLLPAAAITVIGLLRLEEA